MGLLLSVLRSGPPGLLSYRTRPSAQPRLVKSLIDILSPEIPAQGTSEFQKQCTYRVSSRPARSKASITRRASALGLAISGSMMNSASGMVASSFDAVRSSARKDSAVSFLRYLCG